MPRKKRSKVTVSQAIEMFFQALAPEGLSKSILDDKRRTLSILVKHTGDRLTYSLRVEHFTDCLADLAAGASPQENAERRARRIPPRRARTPQSLMKDRAHLKQFVDYLKFLDLVPASFFPLYQITRTKKENVLVGEAANRRRFGKVPVEDWARLMDTATHPRERMLIAAGLGWGGRAGTIQRIQIKHVDMDRKLVDLANAKIGRQYALPIWGHLLEELPRWLAWYEKMCGPLNPEWYLVPSRVGSGAGMRPQNTAPEDWPLVPTKAIARGLVARHIKTALGRIGWNDTYGEGGHTLRRSLAEVTHAAAGLDGAMVAMDHSSTGMTLIYTKNAPGREKLNAAMKNLVVPGYETKPEPPTPTPEPVSATDSYARELAPVLDLSSRKRVA